MYWMEEVEGISRCPVLLVDVSAAAAMGVAVVVVVVVIVVDVLPLVED